MMESELRLLVEAFDVATKDLERKKLLLLSIARMSQKGSRLAQVGGGRAWHACGVAAVGWGGTGGWGGGQAGRHVGRAGACMPREGAKVLLLACRVG